MRGGAAVGMMAAAAGFANCESSRGELFSSRILSREDVASTRWLKLQTIQYVDQKGQQRQWDMCSRTTRSVSASSSEVDAVAVLARLRSRRAPKQVLWPISLSISF